MKTSRKFTAAFAAVSLRDPAAGRDLRRFGRGGDAQTQSGDQGDAGKDE